MFDELAACRSKTQLIDQTEPIEAKMMAKVTSSKDGDMGEVMIDELTPLHEHVRHALGREVTIGNQH